MNASYHVTSSTSFFYLSENDHNAPPRAKNTVSIPISGGETPPHIPGPDPAAVRIQAAFRSHLVRALVRRIRAADAEAGRFERLIQRQDTVDAVRRDARERLRVAEGLMALLLRLDAVPGFYPAVRDLRRRVSRRIVGLQEVLDAVVGTPEATVPELFPASLEEFVAGIGGGEQERAAEEVVGSQRGYECWERFLFGA